MRAAARGAAALIVSAAAPGGVALFDRFQPGECRRAAAGARGEDATVDPLPAFGPDLRLPGAP